jgi:predicted  nucleic acid-binding Zn-ribbon protein
MRREHRGRGNREGMLIGWISMSEALLTGFALMLVVALAAIARLHQLQEKTNKAISELTGERDLLQKQLARASQDLRIREADCLALERDNKKAEKAIDALQKDLTQARVELARTRKALAGLEKEKESLLAVRKDLLREVARLEEDLRARETQLAEARKTLARVQGQLRSALAARLELEKEKARLEKVLAGVSNLPTRVKEIQKQLVEARAKADLVQKQANARVEDLETALKTARSREKQVHKELIGLEGKLHKVVLIFDASGSMNTGERWPAAIQVVETWLRHLEVDECALLVFSTDVSVFPREGGYLNLRGEEAAKNRTDMINWLKHFKPAGGTNTLAALRKAYKYRAVDTIILFTDGAPNDGKSSAYDLQIGRQIFQECAKHKDIPVNTIGLGDYFKDELSHFLMEVARITGGTFLGR